MIVGLLPPRISADLSLVSGFLTWVTVLVWLWRSGWRIQRRYFVEATQTPLTRNAIVWVAALVGAVSFVAAQMRPGIPAVLVVSMVGALSAYVDARTHRLPNAYTLVMGIGVVAGIVIGAVISPLWQERLSGSLIGALIWLVPIWVLNRLPGGMGGGPSWGPWSDRWGCTPPSLPSCFPSSRRGWPPCGRSSWVRPARSRASQWDRG